MLGHCPLRLRTEIFSLLSVSRYLVCVFYTPKKSWKKLEKSWKSPGNVLEFHLKFRVATLLYQHVLALLLLLPKWAQPPLISQRLTFYGLAVWDIVGNYKILHIEKKHEKMCF